MGHTKMIWRWRTSDTRSITAKSGHNGDKGCSQLFLKRVYLCIEVNMCRVHSKSIMFSTQDNWKTFTFRVRDVGSVCGYNLSVGQKLFNSSTGLGPIDGVLSLLERPSLIELQKSHKLQTKAKKPSNKNTSKTLNSGRVCDAKTTNHKARTQTGGEPSKLQQQMTSLLSRVYCLKRAVNFQSQHSSLVKVMRSTVIEVSSHT